MPSIRSACFDKVRSLMAHNQSGPVEAVKADMAVSMSPKVDHLSKFTPTYWSIANWAYYVAVLPADFGEHDWQDIATRRQPDDTH